MPFNLMVQDRVPELTMRGAENLGAGIQQFGAGIGRFFEKWAEAKEGRKKEAQIATSLRTTLKKLDEGNAEKYDVMSGDELRGAFEAIGMKGKMDRDQAALDHYKRMIQAEDEKKAQAQAMVRAFKNLSQMGQSDEEVPYVLPAEERQRRTAPVTGPRIAGAFADAGAAPPMGAFDDILRAFQTRQGGAVPGTVLPVQGRPDLGFGVQSGTGAGTFLPMPKPDRRVPIEKAPKIDGYDILPTDDGGFRYERKPNAKSAVDLTRFDANGDGQLTGQEVQRAMLASAMASQSMPYEGMPVGESAPAAKGNGAEGGLFDQFKRWQKK